MSEMVALLAAILLMPENMNITIRTDAKSVVDSINGTRDYSPDGYLNTFYTPQRKRIVAAARPVLNMVRVVISARSGMVTLLHVKAHSGCSDVHSLMNEAADKMANRAIRLAAEDEDLPYHMFGEEYVGVNVMRANVIGSNKKEILRSLDPGSVLFAGFALLYIGVLQE